MEIPAINYLVNDKGKKIFVQMNIEEWEIFLSSVKKMENMIYIKNTLKEAFREVNQIKQGKKPLKTLEDFLKEL
jgi:hypothetical protein